MIFDDHMHYPLDRDTPDALNLDEATRAKLLCENARRFYRLD
ncbi:MAG: hypothetical protein V2A58_07745 [Planctomycetota bacterium]